VDCKKLFIFLFVSVFFVGCSARLPTPQIAQKVISKHFMKYGKKYKTTNFAQYPVEKVEIIDIKENQKNIVSIDAYVILGESQAVHRVNVITRKKALRWRIISWENIASR